MRSSAPPVLMLAVLLTTPSCTPVVTDPADLILHGGTIVFVEEPPGPATAVAVRAGRIVFVGDDRAALALAGPATRVVDLAGRAVIPGLIDAHGHVTGLGFALGRLDAVGTAGPGEVADLVRQAAARAGPGEWILGSGWDQNDWEVKAFPGRALLDEAAPDHPVALSRIDGHALWVNSRALEAAGIDAGTSEPPGGKILREPDGAPSGILVDNAEELVTARIPAPGRPQVREAILRGLNRCLDSGLTFVHDAGIDLETAEIYRELAAQRALPIRVHAMIGGNSLFLEDYFTTAPMADDGTGFLSIRALKLGIDGALGSRGAALLEDYADDPGNTGLITRDPESIRSIAMRATQEGWQVCVHAIGDRGNRLALDALEAALAEGAPGDHRFRIEHAQILAPSDLSRFGRAGIIPSMQATHCTSDMPWAEARLGAARIEGAYAWRRLLDTGVRIPNGSDFPVESENPFLGLYAAVTRQDAEGRPDGGWRPGERMTALEALRSFTLDAAWAAFREGDLGSIAVGKRADLVVLERSPLEVEPRDLLSMRPEAVLVDGRVARVAEALREALPTAE